MSSISHLPAWKKITIAIVIIAIAIPVCTIRPIDTHLILGAFAVMGLIIYLVAGRGGKGFLSTEDGLYEELLRKCRGDRNLVNRLVEYERKRNPNAEIVELLRDAIERLEYDRR